jgi:hypothetical protein
MARNKSKVSYKLKLDLSDVNVDDREKVKKKVGKLLLDKTKQYLKDGKTPISNGTYRKTLTKSHRNAKLSKGQPGYSDMKFTDEMLRDLKVKTKPNSKIIEIGIEGEEAAKTFAHHTSYRGHPTIKNRSKYKREFIPNKGQKYKRNILSEVNRIIDEHSGEE